MEKVKNSLPYNHYRERIKGLQDSPEAQPVVVRLVHDARALQEGQNNRKVNRRTIIASSGIVAITAVYDLLENLLQTNPTNIEEFIFWTAAAVLAETTGHYYYSEEARFDTKLLQQIKNSLEVLGLKIPVPVLLKLVSVYSDSELGLPSKDTEPEATILELLS